MPIQADPEFQSDFLSPSAFSSEESTNTQQDAEELVEDLLQFLTPTRSNAENLASFENERMQRYRTWFAQSAQANRSNVAARDYARSAAKTILPDGQEISTFAPFHPDLSALQTFTPAQLLTIGALLLLWIAGVACFHLVMLSATIAAITILYTFMLGLNVLMAVKAFQQVPEEQIDDSIVHELKDVEWPVYTILCPLYKEAAVVPQFVRAMQALDYPADKLQILFLTEVDDVETRNAIRTLTLPAHFQIVTVPDGTPRTKPRACNYGLLQATGDYVVIFDAEDVPDILQMKKAVLTFANHGPEVACVQAKLNFYNITQNVLTRWFTAEYSYWFDLVLPGLQQVGLSLPLGGTSNHFRTSVLRALGGWDAYNVTEDCDLGLRLMRYRLKTIVLNSTTYEEANSQLKNWLRQRSRWIKGYMQTYLVHMRNPLRYFREGRQHDLLSLNVVVGVSTVLPFLNTLMWLLLAIYMAFGSTVLSTYHILFPTPVLYVATLSLIFGNFFYMFLYLLGCLKRKQYTLMLWTIFIPIYWALISTAAFIALFELIVRPHYWQKTVHGLHLKNGEAPVSAAVALSLLEVEEEAILLPADEITASEDVLAVEQSFNIIDTVPLPAISVQQQHALDLVKRSKARDLWFFATLLTACVASILALVYFFQQHETLLYGDAYSHMRIARSVIDSATPGFAQLGGIWLPLPHLLMLPFIWNNTLWTTGLAGSFVGMICYVASGAYLYLSIRTLSKNGFLSFLGTLLFLLNPNILYLQTTGLSELVCIWTLTMASYYFLLWARKDKSTYLILAAASTFLATLARYDGWSLFVALFALIIVIGLLKKQRMAQIVGNITIFTVMGSFGILLWLTWNKLIFGDPLFFQHSAFSSQGIQMQLRQSGALYAYHNAGLALKTYTLNVIETCGIPLFIVAVLGFVLFFVRRRYTPDMLATLAFVTPFALYVISLYSGQAVIWIPGAVPVHASVQLYNVRYGSEMVAPIALFTTLLVARGLTFLKARSFRRLAQVGFALAIIAQVLVVAFTGIITLQDGQYGLSCTQTHLVNAYLAQHYAGGKILEDVSAGDYSATETGIDFKNVIYDGNSGLWQQALAHPESVDWIMAVPGFAGDRVSRYVPVNSPAFLAHFTPVVREVDGLVLYHRNTGLPMANNPVPTGILTDHSQCLIGMSK